MKNVRKVGAVALPLSLIAGHVSAAVPTAVTDSLTAAQADGVTIATAVFVAIVALFAFSLMRKGLR